MRIYSLMPMRNREAGEFFPSSEELDREKQTQKRHEEQQQREFLQKQAEEEERRLRPTENDRLRWEKEERERQARENDPVQRALRRAAERPVTPEEQRAQEAREMDERIRRSEERRRLGLDLSPSEQREWDARAEAGRMEELRKEDERREFRDRQDRENYDRMRQEKAPREKVEEMVGKKSGMRLESGSVDIRDAIPALAERIREEGGDTSAADALEVQLKTLDELAAQALMFGKDYEDGMDAFVQELQMKILDEARRHSVDLAALPQGERGGSDAMQEKKEPAGPLETSLEGVGIDPEGVDAFLASLPEGGMISERKMLESSLKGIREKLGSGATVDSDEFLRSSIDQFTRDLKRSMERNKTV